MRYAPARLKERLRAPGVIGSVLVLENEQIQLSAFTSEAEVAAPSAASPGPAQGAEPRRWNGV